MIAKLFKPEGFPRSAIPRPMRKAKNNQTGSRIEEKTPFLLPGKH